MATKPTVLPRWANVGADVVTPASGKQDIGWVSQERPPAEWQNWLSLHAYNWLAWLDDMVLSDDGTQVHWRSTKEHVFDGRLQANTGNTTFAFKVTQTNNAGQGLSVDTNFNTGGAAANAIACSGAGYALEINSNGTNGTALVVTKGGGGTGVALNVTGLSTLNGAVTISTGGLAITLGGITVAAGLSDFQAGAKTNEADIRHADKHTWVPIFHGNGDTASNGLTGTITSNVPYLRSASGAWDLVVRLPVIKGDRLKEIHCYGYDNDGGNNFSFAVYKNALTNGGAPGAASQLGSTQNSASSSTNIQKLSVTGLTESISGDDTQYYAIMSAGAATSDGHRIYALKMVCDRNA